jgi:Na+-transporting methylmalonyl-CoA/oxaloacetate decarboxylase gamma subunit
MINLLPIEEKKILKTEEKWRMVLILGVLVLSFLFCLILILSSIKIYIAGKVEAQKFLVEAERKEYEKSEALKEDIALVNQNLQKLNSFYQQSHLSDTLEKISSTLSYGIYLNDFSYQKQSLEKEDNFDIVLSGFAPNLETLFEFRKSLEKNFSTEVDVGESVIKPQEFRFVFKIKVEKVK